MNKPAILVIEDDPVLLRILCKLVENGGYTPLPAMSAISALETLKEHYPSLILGDISLPDLNGIELVHTIRNIPGFENMPVIYVSASAARLNAAREVGARLTDYLVKPLKPAQLLIAIDDMLESVTQRAG